MLELRRPDCDSERCLAGDDYGNGQRTHRNGADYCGLPAGDNGNGAGNPDLDTEITVSGVPSGTPQSEWGYGLGESKEARMAASIRVNGAPADGLNICLPLPAALATEAVERALTLLRYTIDAGRSAVAGAGRWGDAICADRVPEYGVFAAAYMVPNALGVPTNLAAVPGSLRVR